MITAFIAAASVAVSAATGPGLGISPAVVTGPAYSTATFTVRDAGTTPLHLRVQAVEERPVKGGGWTRWQEYDHATVTPDLFNLKPGQQRQVKVIIHATDGLAHRIAVTALAKPAAVASGAAVEPAVAGIYKVTGAANPYPGDVVLPKPVPPAPPFNWLPVWLAAGGAAILAGLIQAGRKLKISRG